MKTIVKINIRAKLRDNWMLELLDKDYKTTMINILKDLVKKWTTCMTTNGKSQQRDGNFIKRCVTWKS